MYELCSTDEAAFPADDQQQLAEIRYIIIMTVVRIIIIIILFCFVLEAVEEVLHC